MRFALGPYDHTRPLVIDPVLVYSTYLGGSSADQGNAIAVDSSGNAYVTGVTGSPNFPTANPFQASYGGGSTDAFVAKLSWNGSALSLVYSTYLGGNSGDYGTGIAVDSSGNAYVTGNTESSNFPLANAFQTRESSIFVTELNPTGSALIFSTFFGGSEGDTASGIAVDSSGYIYVTGQTSSPDFPTLHPLQALNLTGSGADTYTDAFVTKFNPSGAGLVYSTYLGGSGNDWADSIAVDSSGNAYVTGATSSTDFPLMNPFQATCYLCNSGALPVTDAFIAKLNAAGTALVYSTYLGGTGCEEGHGIAVDASGNAYVAGATSSTNFPTVNPIQANCPVCTNSHPSPDVAAFVSKLNAAGSALVYSTYLGGGSSQYGAYGLAAGIALDPSGDAFVIGYIGAGLPLVNPLQSTAGSFVAELNASGSALVYSTYLDTGGYGANAIALDVSGNAYVTGYAYSGFATLHSLQPFTGDEYAPNAIVVKLSPANLPTAALSASGLTFGSQIVGTTSGAQSLTVTNEGSEPLSISSVSASPEFAEVDNCGAPIPPLGTCSVQLTFTPTSVGIQSGTLTFTDNSNGVAGSTQTANLAGTGVAPLATMSVSSLTFGYQAVGTTSASKQVVLTNLGSSTLSASILSTSIYFPETDNCGSVSGNASCTISVTFKPTTVGWIKGQLTINLSSNGVSNPTQYIALDGTGTAGAYSPARAFFSAGTSAMFGTFALAAGLDNAAGAGDDALCGEHHWTQHNGAQLIDPRSSGIAPVTGDIWIAWDDDFLNRASGHGVVCFYISTDSVVATREYFARGTVAMLSADNAPDGNVVPLLGGGEPLPQPVHDLVNGSLLNVAVTELRPEDAKFATIRALTAAGARIPRTSYTGAGYGPFPMGTPIQDATANNSATPVDFVIPAGGDLDPWTALPGRNFSVYRVGASPVLVINNKSNAEAGHLGDGNYTNINRYVLADVFTGKDTHIRQIAAVSGEEDAPIHVWQREPLSGTFNIFEFCVTLTGERWPTILSFAPNGQETGVNPANTANCLVGPCTSENGNPFYHLAPNGATRGRVAGAGNMVAAVDATADSIGYALWGFSNFASTVNTQYMTVDGVDPLYATPSGGVIPKCAVLPCLLPLTHVADGTYPIWSMLRMVYDDEDPTCLANGINIYAQAMATNTLSDFIPFPNMRVFRSHFGQLVNDTTYAGQVPHNGITAYWPVEYGGDMGGAVLTIQSELDYAADNGGQAEQVNERQ